MACRDTFGLTAAIKHAAQYIPLDLMMTVGAQEAQKLAARYRDARVTEMEILEALVSEVQKLRAATA